MGLGLGGLGFRGLGFRDSGFGLWSLFGLCASGLPCRDRHPTPIPQTRNPGQVNGLGLIGFIGFRV